MAQSRSFRYSIADPAFVFYYEFVSLHEAALERTEADYVWRVAIAPRLDTYIGHVFEQIAEQAYAQLQLRCELVHQAVLERRTLES